MRSTQWKSLFSGRSAIITGGSKGIGFAIATRFATSGADIAIIARGRPGLEEAVGALKKKANGKVVGVQADVGCRRRHQSRL